MFKPFHTLPLFFAIAACATAPRPAFAPVAAPTAAQSAAPTFQALVSAAHPLASAAGLEMLKKGGSAADAAAATMLALTVVEPQSSGIGGGGLLVYQGPNGALATIDGRETAPAVARPGQFLGPDGKAMPFERAATGGRAVGVPGNIALIAEAHRRWGRLPWADLFGPAIRLAEGGYDASPRLSLYIGYGAPALAQDPAGAALYLDASGKPIAAGTRVVNPALAATFRAIAAGGSQAFYTGKIAADIARSVVGAQTNPTAMTLADIAAYQVKARAPVCGSYRSYRICGMGPPSSGGVMVLQVLKQLEGFDMGKLGKDNPVSWHLIAESQRLAYADRAKWIGDEDFVKVPVAGLIDPAYTAARGRLISATARMADPVAGTPRGAPPRTAANDNEVPGTSHFVAADGRGGFASYTSTVERPFGSGLVVDGFVLNNEMTDFNFDPADEGALTANRVQPGKRPRSSMAPTIVYDSKGKVVLVIGAAGGSTIPAQVAKAIMGVIDWGLPVKEALALPQMVAMGDRMAIEKGSALEAMIPALTALGDKPVPAQLPLKLNALQRVAGGWAGAADPRSEGAVAGY